MARHSKQQQNINNNNDSLDQFISILKQLPKDCFKLVQWVYQLGVWNDCQNDTTAIFLSSTATTISQNLLPPPPAPLLVDVVEVVTSSPRSQPDLIKLRQQNNKTPTIKTMETSPMPIYVNAVSQQLSNIAQKINNDIVSTSQVTY